MLNPRKSLMLGFVAAAFGCTKAAPPAAGPGAAAAAPAVSVVKPERKPIRRVIEQPGTVQAFEETSLYPKIAGYIRSISVDPDKVARNEHDRLIDLGSKVKQGQVLAELHAPELDEDVKQKESIVRQYQAEQVQSTKAIAASDAAINASKARLAEAKAAFGKSQALFERWQSETTRVGKLATGGLIDNQSKDETLNQFKAAEAARAEATAKVASAEADVAKAQADREKANADLGTAAAKLEVGKADARRAEVMRDYTRIVSPYPGIVTRRFVSTGDFLVGDGRHAVFSVARTDPVRVVVGIPEADAGLVEMGQEVKLSFPGTTGQPATGKVSRTSWSLDPGSRTLRTELDLPNPDGKIRPGSYLYGRMTLEMPPEWSVPSTAIIKLNDESVMYLVEDGKAVKVFVEPYRGDGQTTQIRRYKKSPSADWTAVTGSESVALPAAIITEGQKIP